MKDDNLLDFNFWPSFADMMLCLVLILIILLFIIIAGLAANTVNLEVVNNNQEEIINSIASSYGVTPEKIAVNTYGISTMGIGVNDIIIRNEPTMQRIIFTDHILFNSDEYSINPQGQEALSIVGQSLLQKLDLLSEIQIQGHADVNPSRRFSSNMQLASMRALAVFDYMNNQVGIDPTEHMISATSFGEFKPVQREDGALEYDWAKLQEDNDTEQKRQSNRRIELLLLYKVSDEQYKTP